MAEKYTCGCACCEQERKHEHEHHQNHKHGCGCGHDHEHHDHGCGCGHDHEHGDENMKLSLIIRLIIGGLAMAVALLGEHVFHWSGLITLAVALAGYAVVGYDVVLTAVKNILRGRVFDECFLMSLSTLAAFFIGEYAEAVAVMLFYQIGELFSDVAVARSRKSITELMDLRPDHARVFRHGDWVEVTPDEVEIGDTIMVNPGELVPLDGVVLEGESFLDTKALTGESVPRRVTEGEEVLSGAVNTSSPIRIIVTRTAGESTAAKILKLVESESEKKAPEERFITKFARYYTPAVVAVAALVALIPPLFDGQWAEWIRRACVTLVVSCPCALVVSVPLAYFAGVGKLSRSGVLVKGSVYLDKLARLSTVVTDKTGTLTSGTFRVTAVHETMASREEILHVAASSEVHSSHPIARSLAEAYSGALYDVESVKERTGFGIVCEIGGGTVAVGSRELMAEQGIKTDEIHSAGTVVYVARGGEYMGTVEISDSVKKEAVGLGEKLRRVGIERFVMLTGDRRESAEAVSRECGVSEVHHSLLPADKAEVLGEIMANSAVTAFIGDGINDAPSLKKADIGIAMGGVGSDAAVEAADAVLMGDDPSRILDAVSISRKTRSIVRQNIIFSVAVKLAFITLGALGLTSMWAAVFADVGVMVLAVMNAMRE